MSDRSENDQLWYDLISGVSPKLQEGRVVFTRLPANRRCKLCFVPFDGITAPIVRMLTKRRRGRKNPNFCDL